MNKQPHKILLVDDDSLFLKLMVQVFTKSGFECQTATSAEGALVLLDKKNPPDIILSDYNMGQMNGLEFRKHLMKDEVFKNIPFLFLTYFSDSDLMIQGFDLQAIDYVLKNTPVNVIVSKVNNILYAVDKQRELSEQEVRKAATSLNIKSIPANVPNTKGFKIDFWHKTFDDIPGGDFIDFIRVDERYTFTVLGDVMGKKWMAWFFTFGFLSYIRSAVRFAASNGEYSTATILQQVNKVICFDDVLTDILSSLSLLLIDSQTGAIAYSGAGDLPLLHYIHAERKFATISSSGLLLGLFPDGVYNQQEILMQTNDELFIFTDGMIDFADAGGKKSDYNKFASTLLEKLNTHEPFTDVKSHFDAFGANQIDDQSVICIYKL
ncbi:response regulator [Mucilaginibacter auburnensis]|uniref:Sigma-B regulation protein RsbU (Phosphoserine phosphatase) n=1 Tax=Mucilaginibacter auburnensis TaxID=1457233 RepID=A0A2H9VVV1_9SPHI|nr:response regulator [Mucilaginibacter auburnensis]PJJ84963.1 sigma-B regulation protein RsbU (phosphoserine phosphatase) [Mucilaginibacter auburnensis]